MSKEEFLKIQTCVLKVNIHCDGCKHKVKKILQKIEGVYTTNIDSEQGKVTVSGNVDPATMIKKLHKNGKHAELWGAPKGSSNNNQNQVNNQFKNLQIDNGKFGNNNKGQGQHGQKGGGNNQAKVGGPQGQNHPQMKGFQDLKLPQLPKDLKLPQVNSKAQKPAGKFNLPEDEGATDDEFEFDDDEYDEYDDDDDSYDDELDDATLNKMKPGMGHGPNVLMNAPQLQQAMKSGNLNGGGNNGWNGKKSGGGGGNIPVHMNLGGNGGKKGEDRNNNGGNQNQAGGKGGKNGAGPQNDGQNKNDRGGGGGATNHFTAKGGKDGGGINHGMPHIMPMSTGGGGMVPMGNMLPMGPMSNLAAPQGLPAMGSGGGGGNAIAGSGAGNYTGGGPPEHMGANPNPYLQLQQQQLAAMMMNQQRANGSERFQPMMYARPVPAVNYMPPPYPPYNYNYPPPPGERTDQYTMFSDENATSCSVM